eukprot:25459-Chlamydomonas_euryale.AAC.5
MLVERQRVAYEGRADVGGAAAGPSSARTPPPQLPETARGTDGAGGARPPGSRAVGDPSARRHVDSAEQTRPRGGGRGGGGGGAGGSAQPTRRKLPSAAGATLEPAGGTAGPAGSAARGRRGDDDRRRDGDQRLGGELQDLDADMRELEAMLQAAIDRRPLLVSGVAMHWCMRRAMLPSAVDLQAAAGDFASGQPATTGDAR